MQKENQNIEELEDLPSLEGLAQQAGSNAELSGDELPDFEPDLLPAVQPPNAEAHASAALYAELAEGLLLMVWPMLEFTPETKEAFAEKLAPVLEKSGGELPEWLIPFKEEIALVGFCAATGFVCYQQVKADKQKQAEQPAKEQPEQPENAQS